MKNLRKISFKNKNQPASHFDLIKLKDVLKTGHDHSPTNFHIVEFFIIIFIEAGKGSHTIDFTDYKCEKGTLLTIRKDQIHKFGNSGNLQGSLLLFTDEFLYGYLEEMETHKSMQLFNELLSSPQMHLSIAHYDIIRDSMNRMREEYDKQKDTFSLSIIRSELHILITKLFRIKSQNKQIESQRKYLKEFLELQKQAEINTFQTTRVKDYAQFLGKSTKTLNTITQAIVNKSAKEFIDEICINRIKRLLINTELSITEIAYEAGFEETANFYKYFKRQTQLTPENYRTVKR